MDSDYFIHNVLSPKLSDGLQWKRRVGLLIIDDEKLSDTCHNRSNATGRVGFVLRNYYSEEADAAGSSIFHFPLGWRTTDGDFFSDHTSVFETSYLERHRQNPHARSFLYDAPPITQRSIRTFFVGTIRVSSFPGEIDDFYSHVNLQLVGLVY